MRFGQPGDYEQNRFAVMGTHEVLRTKGADRDSKENPSSSAKIVLLFLILCKSKCGHLKL
jgi:hypothetical protein